jgi:hypothetical protein
MVNDKLQKIRGSAIFEILVVIAIMGVVITSVVASSTRSVKNSLHAKYQAEGTRRGEELIEWIRSVRDSETWPVFSSRAVSGGGVCTISAGAPMAAPAPRAASSCREYCIADAFAWSTCGNGMLSSGPPFYRRAQLRTIDASTVEVTVIVDWTDGIGSHSSRVTTQLTSWNN